MKNTILLDQLLDYAALHKANGQPFVLYAKPGDQLVQALFLKDEQQSTGAGFVFTSFDGATSHLIPFQNSEQLVAISSGSITLNNLTQEQLFYDDAFCTKVENAVQEIKAGHLKKVVLSRFEEVPATLDDFIYFKRILHAYIGAFRYWFYHPKVGTWMGATPEKLVAIKDGLFEVMSLAGTRLKHTNGPWGNKEIEEQAVVTQYVVNSLAGVAIKCHVAQPYTHQAGEVEHIRTDITGTCASIHENTLIKRLHPTPAVCGLPKKEAADYISACEGYNREFYTGYLGLIGDDEPSQPQTDLYVNLRCMKIVNQQATLFMGCGITANSVPQDELIETVNKSLTMKKVLQ